MARLGWFAMLVVIAGNLVGPVTGAAHDAAYPPPPIAAAPIDLGIGFKPLYVYGSKAVGGLSTGSVLLGEIRNTGDQPAVAPVLRFGLLALYAPPGARIPIAVDPCAWGGSAVRARLPGLQPPGWPDAGGARDSRRLRPHRAPGATVPAGNVREADQLGP